MATPTEYGVELGYLGVWLSRGVISEKIKLGLVNNPPPPRHSITSIERYDQMVTALGHTKCDLMIGTDQNFDYMKVDTNQNVSDLLNVFFTQGLLPTVKRPTRITHTSSTVIDNIYVKCRGYENIDSTIILSDISDHLPILTYDARQKLHLMHVRLKLHLMHVR